MLKLTARDREILAALEIYPSAGDVAAVTQAPLRRVIHLQRLWGSGDCQEQRRQEDHERLIKARMHTARAHERNGPSPLDVKLMDKSYGAYWRQLEGVETPPPKANPRYQKPQREARMVPDDRADEGIDFDDVMNALVNGIQAEGQRGEGRGAA